MEIGSKHLRGFDYARLGSQRSDFPATRKCVGAAYVDGPRIIIASNMLKTAPIAKRYGSIYERIHAEMNCLQGIDDPSGGELYVYRETANGNTAMARPCEFCMKLLIERGCRHVYFTTNTGYEYLDTRSL
jgi:deoxycytidylate deaminase